MPINIVVCVKWVPNTTVVNVDPTTGTLIREGVPSIINPHDLGAVELALRLKERDGGQVTALAMSPPAARSGLEFLIGMGVDKGILITDRLFAAADTFATSYVLAKAMEELRPDLIVFGQETIDSSTSHIGAQVSSWLGLPYVYYVTSAEVLNGKHELKVTRSLENEVDVYELPLPCAIVVMMKSHSPRPVRMNNKIRAKVDSPIVIWTNETLKLDTNRTGLRGSPTVVARSIPTPTVPRKKQKFDGRENPVEAAKWIVDSLRKEGMA